MTDKSRSRVVREPAVARKNMDMDITKLKLAREILDARTDTETVDRALEYVLAQHDIVSATQRLLESEALTDAFGRSTRQSRSRTRR